MSRTISAPKIAEFFPTPYRGDTIFFALDDQGRLWQSEINANLQGPVWVPGWEFVVPDDWPDE